MTFRQFEKSAGQLESLAADPGKETPLDLNGSASTEDAELSYERAELVRGELEPACGQIIFHCLTRVLEELDLAALVQDRQGRIIATNAKMSEVAGSLVDQNTRSFVFSDEHSGAAFVDATEKCFAHTSSHRPIDLSVTDNEQAALLLQLWPLASVASSLATASAVLVLVKRARIRPEQIMTDHFALTKTETRIVKELFAGETVLHIARAHNVKPDTIRTQLKSIFSKTSTGRQSQLVALYAKAHAPEAFKEFALGAAASIIDTA